MILKKKKRKAVRERETREGGRRGQGKRESDMGRKWGGGGREEVDAE